MGIYSVSNGLCKFIKSTERSSIDRNIIQSNAYDAIREPECPVWLSNEHTGNTEKVGLEFSVDQ